MARVTRNPLPTPLRPDNLERETGAYTISDVLVDIPSEKNKRGKVTVVVLKEFPGKGLYLNASSLDHLIQGFKSDESNDWKGKQVPLMVVTSEDPRAAKDPTVPRMSKRIWVAPPDQWRTILGKK
jgi:hypothetical protein